MITKIDRLDSGIPDLDSYVNYLCTEIELAANVTVSPPLQMRRTPSGLQLAWSMNLVQIAKSGGSGIPAMSGSTAGSGTVTLYDLSGTTGATVTSQTTTDTALNLASTAVGNNKMIGLIKYNKYWVVFCEWC